MPHDQKAKITAKEAIFRAETIANTQAFLEELPEDLKTRQNIWQQLEAQAEHYKKMYEAIVEIIENDRQKFES